MATETQEDLELGPHRARRHETCLVHNNKHGYRGVEWDARTRLFRARIEPTPGKRGQWLGRFPTAEAAARAYDEAARRVYGADARLNFPSDGERGVIASRRREGVCRQGHDLQKHGYLRPDGRGINCRRCQAEARMRGYYKGKAAITPAHIDKAQETSK